MTRSAILTYHSIDSSGSVISTKPELFREQMRALADAQIPVVPLRSVRRSSGSVALTFDDGFANFEDEALPVLTSYQFPATVFLVSGYCGRRNDWEGQSHAVPRLPLLSWNTIQGLKKNSIEWGAHTVTHPDLTTIPDELLEAEVARCRAEIEDKTGTGVQSFAYPYGSCNSAARAAASRHFELACGTRLRYLSGESDPFELPRLDAYYFRQPSRIGSLMQPGGRFYIGVRRALREGRSWLSP